MENQKVLYGSLSQTKTVKKINICHPASFELADVKALCILAEVGNNDFC